MEHIEEQEEKQDQEQIQMLKEVQQMSTNDTESDDYDMSQCYLSKMPPVNHENENEKKINILTNIWESIYYYFINIIYILKLYYNAFLQEYENRNDKKL